MRKNVSDVQLFQAPKTAFMQKNSGLTTKTLSTWSGDGDTAGEQPRSLYGTVVFYFVRLTTLASDAIQISHPVLFTGTQGTLVRMLYPEVHVISCSTTVSNDNAGSAKVSSRVMQDTNIASRNNTHLSNFSSSAHNV